MIVNLKDEPPNSMTHTSQFACPFIGPSIWTAPVDTIQCSNTGFDLSDYKIIRNLVTYA